MNWRKEKAGVAFVATGFASFPLILAVCALTAVVGFNEIIICAHLPDVGSVNSAAWAVIAILAPIVVIVIRQRPNDTLSDGTKKLVCRSQSGFWFTLLFELRRGDGGGSRQSTGGTVRRIRNYDHGGIA